MRRPVTRLQVTQVRGGVARDVTDGLVTEEPLEIRVAPAGREAMSLAVTMRTPGHDFELVAGFLLSEGVIAGHGDIEAIRYCQRSEDTPQLYNVVTVDLRGSEELECALESARRNVMTTAACGVCGVSSIEQLATRCDPVRMGTTIGLDAVVNLVDELRPHQKVFAHTGGLHAAGLFDIHTGHMRVVREDVGRHNALDKLVGNGVLADRLPFDDCVLLLSGRIGFEMVQKAATAGVPIVAAVSAPSSLAVRTARALGVTLIGFVRDGDCTIYSHAERVDLGVGS